MDGFATVQGTRTPFDLEEKGEAVMDGDAVYLLTGSLWNQEPLHDLVLMDAVGDIFAESLGVERGSDFARLASAPANQRLALLARVLDVETGEAEELLRQASEKLDANLESVIGRHSSAIWMPVPTNPNSARSEDNAEVKHGSNTLDQVAGNNTTTVMPNSRSGPIEAITVEAKVHTPTAPARRIELRVQATPSVTSTPRQVHRVTDAARCQQLVEHFETVQGRYPLPAHHMQGWTAYGCDVLSFISDEDRQLFKDQSHPDTDLVERFIEVKGRNSESGAIELRGNELDAAQRYGRRYYLYRIYEESEGEFSVLTLADPLDTDYNCVYEVNLSQSGKNRKIQGSRG